MIIKGYIFSILYVFLVVLLAELLYKLGIPKKITRKVVHILVGFEWLILYHFFGGGVHTFLVCLLFLILLSIEYKAKLLPMMSSDEDNAPGTVYYAFAMTLVSFVGIFVQSLMIPFGIAVFATSVGDGFAGLFGQLATKYNSKIYGKKTLVGTLSNFAATYLVVLAFDVAFSLPLGPWHYLLIALLATELELFVDRGIDNIAITLGVSAYSFFLISSPAYISYALPIILTPIILAVVSKKRILSPIGILAALLMDVLVSLAFDNLGFLILIIYFVGSIFSDKYKKRAKCKVELSYSDNTRSFYQVFANGIAPTICSLIYIFTGNIIFFVAYVASLAEALSDTLASGIGSKAKQVYDVFKFKKCAPGLSGGMSLQGTLASLLGSLVLSSFALLFNGVEWTHFLIIFAAAFLGTVLDSALGSLLQAKYACGSCGTVHEHREHCGQPSELHSGLRFVTNSTVNLISAVFSALLAIFLTTLI